MDIDRLVESLLGKPEGTMLDFKREPYSLQHPQEKEKLLKDLLCMANVLDPSDKHIVLGVDVESSETPEVVGIKEGLEDAQLQDFVRGKVNRRLKFSYAEGNVRGKRVAVITIVGDQLRPIFLLNDFQGVRSKVVYTRFGSSNGELSPDEWIHLAKDRQHSKSPVSDAPESAHETSLRLVTERWLSIFLNHDVTLSQIPTVMPGFGLQVAAFADWRRLIELLSEDLLAETCNRFNINRAWLDGESPCPYDPIAGGYCIMEWVDAVAYSIQHYGEAEVLAFKDGKPDAELKSQEGTLVLSAPVYKFGNRKWVHRYVPAASFGHWGYPRGRHYAKTMLWVARVLDCVFRGLVTDRQTIRKIHNGEVFIDSIKHGGIAWHPDDYVYSPSESLVAKQSEEFDTVIVEAKRSGLFRHVMDIKKRES